MTSEHGCSYLTPYNYEHRDPSPFTSSEDDGEDNSGDEGPDLVLAEAWLDILIPWVARCSPCEQELPSNYKEKKPVTVAAIRKARKEIKRQWREMLGDNETLIELLKDIGLDI